MNSNRLPPKDDILRVRGDLKLRQSEVIKLFGTITFSAGFNYRVERKRR